MRPAAARRPPDMGRDDHEKERHGGNPKSSVNAPEKKSGGGGKFTMGKAADTSGGTFLDRGDPNFDPDERRTDPDDGVAYKYDELAAFYKGKFNKQAIAEYWEYVCTPVKKKSSAKVKEGLKGPTIAESLEKTMKYVPKDKAKDSVKRLSAADLECDGPLAKEVSAVIPYFPYKRLDKFYDIQGLLKHPKLFNAVCAVFARRFRSLGITKIAAFEARGFLFSPVAVRLDVPFVMLRKDGKLPNSTKSSEYSKEYEGSDVLCVQNGAVVEGDKVALIDDLLATGGTLCAGIELMKALKAEVTECTCLIGIKDLGGRDKCTKAGAKNVWCLISDDLLNSKADLSATYKDDGRP